MPQFKYEAKNGPKEIVTGVVEAPNQTAAVDKLTHMGYVPIKVAPASQGTQETKHPTRHFIGETRMPAARARNDWPRHKAKGSPE